MSRNAEQHFTQVPHAEIRRSSFKRPFSLLTTINEGDLVPIYVDEVLPADTFKIDLNSLVRMSTPLYPVMDNCDIDYYMFFVPARLLWEHFENLMGQNDSSFWAENVEYTTPVTTAPKGGWENGTIADYFGIPTGVENLKVNSLPFRAYAKIWNDWFKDENLQQPVTMSKTDATTEGSNTGNKLTDAEAGGLPLKVAKHKDYFTSCLPSPQKGEAVQLPLNGNAYIKYASGTKDNEYYKLQDSNDKNRYGLYLSDYENYQNGSVRIKATLGEPFKNIKDDKTREDIYLAADLGSVTATTINELRNAIAVQHILERDARTGTRYKEYLKGAWGVTSPDARLDRSEYIGGCRVPININQVIQTSSTNETSPQGNAGAYSMTTNSQHMCTYSATEHGYVIGLACVRVQHSYQYGLRRMWTRSTRFSYYDPMLANLGEQAVLNQEIYAQGNEKDEEVFGYQEAWADYKYRTNEVTCEMRSNYAQTLDAWHYADKYTSLPTLSDKWIKESKENIDRTIAVQSANSHQFICNFYFEQTWTRAMPVYNIPGLDTI
jgi:hypothetical protein